MSRKSEGSAKELIRKLIEQGKTDEQIIAAVQKKIPESAVNTKHCTKYRRELFVEDNIGPEKAAVMSKDHREWALANMAAAKKGPHKAYWIARDKAEKAKAAEAKKAATKAKTPAKKSTKKAA